MTKAFRLNSGFGFEILKPTMSDVEFALREIVKQDENSNVFWIDYNNANKI